VAVLSKSNETGDSAPPDVELPYRAWCTLLMKTHVDQPSGKVVWRLLQKLKLEPAVTIREMEPVCRRDICTAMLLAA
jgi:hypothetical protein